MDFILPLMELNERHTRICMYTSYERNTGVIVEFKEGPYSLYVPVGIRTLKIMSFFEEVKSCIVK